ncbi:MAG: pilus assembly protein PilP [Desulfobacterales bacterium]|jgi:type IV pilus assembly protein PilP
MDKIIVIMRTFIFLICFFFLLIGCDQKTEPPPKAKKITQKIVIDKKEESKPQESKKTEVPKPGPIQEVAKPIPELSPDVSRGKVDVAKEKRVASVSATTEKIEPPKTSDLYNPEGKLDPFAPLIKEKPVNLPVKHRKAVRRKLLTPLEKLDLSQLKLVAILRAQSGNRALVEEDSGKGYVIKKGTYIGTHSGKVAKILSDRIIVEEEVEDIYGKISVRERELKLKPPGEE